MTLQPPHPAVAMTSPVLLLMCCFALSAASPLTNDGRTTFEKPPGDVWRGTDRIVSLPGVSDEYMSKNAMYSGYLDVNITEHLFYWYVRVCVRTCVRDCVCACACVYA